jgi:hypothetical protein
MNMEINIIINEIIYPMCAIMATLSLFMIAIELEKIRKKK